MSVKFTKEPIEISSPEDFSRLRENKKSDFIITEDIDFKYGFSRLHKLMPLKILKHLTNDTFEPIKKFEGTLDGQGHTIKNLPIVRSPDNLFKNSRYIGIFGSNEGSIRDLHLQDITIFGGGFVGGLCGENCGEIVNCSVSGRIIGGDYTGGISGHNHKKDSIIKNSSFSGKIVGTDSVGGITGQNNTKIKNCSSSPVISGDRVIGGITGANKNEVDECFSDSELTGNSHVGGLVGSNGISAWIRNSACVVALNKNESSTGGFVGCNQSNIRNCYWTPKGNSEITSSVGSKTDGTYEEVEYKETIEEVEAAVVAGRI